MGLAKAVKRSNYPLLGKILGVSLGELKKNR